MTPNYYLIPKDLKAFPNQVSYQKELLDKYFEALLNEREPNPQLANEMFQTFSSLHIIRFGEVVFVLEGI